MVVARAHGMMLALALVVPALELAVGVHAAVPDGSHAQVVLEVDVGAQGSVHRHGRAGVEQVQAG